MCYVPFFQRGNKNQYKCKIIGFSKINILPNLRFKICEDSRDLESKSVVLWNRIFVTNITCNLLIKSSGQSQTVQLVQQQGWALFKSINFLIWNLITHTINFFGHQTPKNVLNLIRGNVYVHWSCQQMFINKLKLHAISLFGKESFSKISPPKQVLYTRRTLGTNFHQMAV